MYSYNARILAVVDGDTVDADIDLGLYVHTVARLRLLGINAPEIHGPEHDAGQRAKARLAALVEGKTIVITTHKDEREKYGRFLASLATAEGDASEVLIREGLAKPWDGKGTRPA